MTHRAGGSSYKDPVGNQKIDAFVARFNRNSSPENPYTSLAAAQRVLREVGRGDEASAMVKECFAAPTPEAMLDVITRYLDAAQIDLDAAFERLLRDVLDGRPRMLWPISPIES